MEANWLATLLIGSLLSIPISILANIMTPTFQKWFEKRANSVRNKSLLQLKTEYARIKNFKEQPTSLQFVIGESMLKGMLLLCSLVTGVGYFIVIYLTDAIMPKMVTGYYIPEFVTSSFTFLTGLIWIFIFILMLYFSSGIINLLSDYSRLKQFEQFESKTLTRIRELEKDNSKQMPSS